MNIALESLRPCLDGAVPAVVATASPDGTPNVAYASQVHYVDPEHVALSFQFFSKTRENVLAHPYAQVQVIEPVSFRHFRLKVHYLRTETSGPLFEYMKAQLAGIAARTGMAKVFELRGADVYRVLDIENVNPRLLSAPAPPDALLKMRGTLDYLGACDDLAQLADRALAALARGFGIRHALLAMLDESGGALYMLTRLGCELIDMGVVKDDPASLEAALRSACANADAIITSGGVSVGAADYTKQIMAQLGDVTFWKIGMRPGRPMAFGTITSKGKTAYLFGLPGNPVAVMVTFYFFARDALLRMMGAHSAPLPLLRAASATDIRKKPGRTEYQRGILSTDAQGNPIVRITGSQGSGVLRSMSEANCMVVLRHEQDSVHAGDLVDVVGFEGLV